MSAAKRWRPLLVAVRLLLPFPSVAAPDAPADLEGRAAAGEEDELARRLAARLAGDEEARRALAARLMESSLAGDLSGSPDPASASREIEGWILEHPTDAGYLAAGLARDDLRGGREFERSLRRRVSRRYRLNPNRYKGILGQLALAGSASREVLREARLPEDEARELLKRVFEGKDGGSGRELPASGLASGGGFYDRLSAANPTGYSPQVLAFQSGLNARRPPGAPRLVETGRLDHQTLAYPLHAMRHDLGRLEAAGGSRFLARAGRAVSEFQLEAERTRDPARITTATLRTLGLKQKEAGRWIAAAAVETDLRRLEKDAGWMSEELRLAGSTARAPEEARRAAVRQGERLLERLMELRDLDVRTLGLLEGPEYLRRWPECEASLARASALRGELRRELEAYAAIEGRPRTGPARTKPAWLLWLEKWLKRAKIFLSIP